MRFLFYKKTLSKLSTALIVSFIFSRVLNDTPMFFVFALGGFGALYLLLSWLNYLKTDGISFIKSKTLQKLNKALSFLDRFKYKSKGVYNIYKDNVSDEVNEDNAKVSIYSYLFSAIILLVASQIVPNFL